MNDPNRALKWVLVVGMVGLSLLILYPPNQKLKGGIDLVGGTSLIYEIDTTGLDAAQQRGLSERVMNILKERVDPGGRRNLEWRPIGHTRLEIRMPRPPRHALDRRAEKETAFERLRGMNLNNAQINQALSAAAQSPEELTNLERGISSRPALLQVLKTAYDQLNQARASLDQVRIDAATTSYERAMSEVLATNLPINKFTDVLALPAGPLRDKELEPLREKFSDFDVERDGVKPLSEAVEAYDAWSQDKADLEDPSDLKRLLRGAGVLEFRILADRDLTSPGNIAGGAGLAQPLAPYVDQLARFGPRPRAGDRYRWFPVQDIVDFMNLDVQRRNDMTGIDKDDETLLDEVLLFSSVIIERYAGRHYVLVHGDPEFGLTSTGVGGQKKWKLIGAQNYRDPMSGENVVSFELDPRGGAFFGELTGANVGRQLCIHLDGEAISHATINERITTNCQVSGSFTPEDVEYLRNTLEAGALPARLKEPPLAEKTIGPTLGETNRTKGIQAAVFGLIAVMVFMAFYYGLVAGNLANMALAMNLLFVLAVMALMQATFTLPGIAGLILTIGMAVDANVLIFERFREERDRGVVFKKALNTGYDKALSTIIDANLTTLITCVILGMVGSEEIKGFSMTLGIGIVSSMFTALVVTRLVFNTLISKGLLKDLKMRRILHRPSIDWIGLRTKFWPASIACVVGGLTLFMVTSNVDREALYDIEFLGGTSVTVDLKPGVTVGDSSDPMDVQVTEAITEIGREPSPSATDWLSWAADELGDATIEQSEVAGRVDITSANLTGQQIASLMQDAVKDIVVRGGVSTEGRRASFDANAGMGTIEVFTPAVQLAQASARNAADNLHNARIQSVESLATSDGDEAQPSQSFEIVTVETDRELVQTAIVAALSDKLQIQRALSFTTRTDDVLTRDKYFVIQEDHNFLSEVLGCDENYEVRGYKGGVAIEVTLDPSEPPVTSEEVQARLADVTLRPEFESYRSLNSKVFPLGSPSRLSDGKTGYRQFAVVAVDEGLRYDDDPLQWEEQVALAQLTLVEGALASEKSLSRVMQFDRSIASSTQLNTVFAIVLALGAIVAYVWLRFGSMEFGLAAIVALVHDVSITLGMVALSHSVVGRLFGLSGFKINLPMIAALLTVIGYSLNDTIVVFDRIRENRGRLGALSPAVINNSINQTLSRTLLTSITTFMVVLVMFIFGGAGIKGFSFALLMGVVVGTYSSIGIATPLLYRPRVLNTVVMVLGAVGSVGIVFATIEDLTWRLIWSGLAVVTFGGWGLMAGRSATYAGRPAVARA